MKLVPTVFTTIQKSKPTPQITPYCNYFLLVVTILFDYDFLVLNSHPIGS